MLKFIASKSPDSLPPYISYEGQIDGESLFTIFVKNNIFYKNVLEQELISLGFDNIVWVS